MTAPAESDTESTSPSSSLSPQHKLFNQRLLAEHCVTEDRVKQLWAQTVGENHDLHEGLKVCNEPLLRLGLEIVAVADPQQQNEESNAVTYHYALINKFPDAISKTVLERAFAQPYQHAYARSVLEALASNNENGGTKRNDLLNLRLELAENNSKNMTLPAAEQVLESLQAEQWIASTAQNKLVLAPRAFAELSYLLVKEFGMEHDDLPQQIYFR